MNAILIDPKDELIKLVQLKNINDPEEMKKLLDCEMLEIAISFDDIHVDMYCDEEGWLRNREIYGFSFEDMTIPSKALLVGYTDDGKQAPLNKTQISYLLNLLISKVFWEGELDEDDMPQPTVTGFYFDKDGNLIY